MSSLNPPVTAMSRPLSSHEAASHDSIYSSLPLPLKTSTRLLKLLESEDGSIRCNLEVFDLAENPSYRTLSYTWGPPSNEARERGMTADRTYSIICNGKRLLVTKNLFDFLHVGSKRMDEHEGYLWIDAICINQDDKIEKASEVMKMATIYGSADSVLVWLGDSDEYSSRAIELLSVLALCPEAKLNNVTALDLFYPDVIAAKFGTSITIAHWEALSKFFDRTWFTRVWIIQEIIMANDTKALCGMQSLDWQSLVKVSRFISSPNLRSKYFWATVPGTSINICSGASPHILAYLKYEMKNGLNWHLESVLDYFRGYAASEKGDMVYALISLSKDAFLSPQFGTSALLPDYSRAPATTYILAARLILEHSKDLSLLAMVEDSSERKMQGMPSWAPDWSVRFTGLCFHNERFTSAANKLQKHQITKHSNLLLVHGVFLDTVSLIGPPSNEAADIWVALKEWLKILQTLDPVYVTGQPRIEVFWRTLIYDVYMETRSHPAPQSLETSFYKWLAGHLLIKEFAHDDVVDIDLEKAYLDELANKDGFDLHLPEMATALRQLYGGEPFDERIEEINHYDSSFDHISTQRIFRTQNGFLGLGPPSMRPGDEVWILPGLNFPLIIRKAGKVRRYHNVGGGYVHGFMHGEIFAGEEPEMVDIEIE